jgi:hypothetical protein
MGATNFSDGVGGGIVQADGFSGPPVAGTAPGATLPPAAFSSGFTESAADGLTALGGGQAGALALPAILNRFTTVVAGNGGRLPASVKGLSIQVLNSGAGALQLYGTGADTINGAAAAAGISVAVGATALLTCYTAGQWRGPVALV